MGERNFAGVRAAALASAEILLPQWIPGKREGREWVGIGRANGGPGNSWKVNLDTGRFSHFAGDERGGDLIDLYAQLNHLDLGAACDQLAQQLGINGSGIPVLPSRMAAPAPQEPAEPAPDPIPANAPPIPSWGRLGVPDAVYRYGESFAVARYERPDGKTFKQWTWREGGWAPRGYGSDKPLYREDELAKSPRAQVLIVEGEKCADLAAPMIPIQVVVSWAGGAKAVKQTDWGALADREVIIWPDADAPGISAAEQIAEILKSFHARVRILRPPAGTAEGWDIADGIASGMQTDELYEFIRANTPATAAKPKVPIGELITANERIESEDYPGGNVPRSHLIVWKEMALQTNDKDVPHATLSNVSTILRLESSFRGNIWWDSFCERIYHTMRGPVPQEWNDVDSMRATAYIQQQLQLPKVTLNMVEDSIQHAAHENQRNSVQDWLGSLEWDNNERLDRWVGDCLGVELTPYSMAVSRNWIISMVARAYRPACQVDTMPVLEGLQGEGKSSALEILGDRWYSAVGTAFGSYEFINTIQGRWLIEIPDMAGFSRRDHSHVISTITTRTDRYRIKYGHFDEDHPRKCVFAATSETDDYLPEMRGYRRYWPLRCKDINLNALRQQREQIFAEAVRAYRQGASYHAMPKDTTAEEQRSRTTEDLWTEDVLMYCNQRAMAGHPVHPAKILMDSKIEMRRVDMDHAAKLRVSNILKAHGWIPKLVDNQRMWVKPRSPDLGD
jgi:putative DNA primase/helicase